MNKRYRMVLYLLLLFGVWIVGYCAATDFDEEALFGGVSFIDEIDETTPADEFLMREGIEWGGSFRSSLRSTAVWANPEKLRNSPGQPDKEVLTSNLGATIFMDARPQEDYRVFAKVNLAYPFTETEEGQHKRGFSDIVNIHELFADFDHQDRIFFRVGKQTINWGVGYFFSPADIVNLTPIDPDDPEADREGPLSLKVNMPIDMHNLYLYVLAEDATRLDELALAPKAEVVLGGTELGLGAYLKKERAPMAMMTISTGLGKAAVFGEAVVKHGSDKRFVKKVEQTPENPLGTEIHKRQDETFVSGTGGVRYSHTDDQGLFNLTMAAQYFYNGEGYDDTKHTVQISPALVGARQLSASDLTHLGKHQAALTLAWHDALKTGVSANLTCIGSLTDNTGVANASFSWQPLERISASIGASYNYGKAGPFGNPVTVYLGISMGGGQF